MKGDFSRDTFDPTKHYSHVLMQQGRVQVDADWNEQQAINTYHAETVTLDAIGPSGAPNYAPGFAITTDASGKNLMIGKGRYYLDGILCENEEDVAYTAQPDFFDPPALSDLLQQAKTNTAIVYLDVWQRHITMLEDPHIHEQALGEPDTTTRVKTIWQVKFLPVQLAQSKPGLLAGSLHRLILGLGDYQKSLGDRRAAAAEQVRTWAKSLQASTDAGDIALRSENAHTLYQQLPQLRRDLERIGNQTNVSASVPLRELNRLDTELGKVLQEINCHTNSNEWFQLTAPRTNKLTPQVEPPPASPSPCEIKPQGGVHVSENQLYRVEIHQQGELNNPIGANSPTFKWSRDNGSMVVGVTRIDNNQVTVTSLGLDDLTKLAHDQWVEVLDDRLELAGLPGQLVQIDTTDTTDPKSPVVTMKQSVTPLSGSADGVNSSWHPKLRRWDQVGDEQGLKVDTNPVVLEGGISVAFSTGSYKTGDYWLMPARSNSTIEWPPFDSESAARAALPPIGIKHHYCRLGLVDVDQYGHISVHDCRRIFAPLAAPAMRVVATNWENDLEFSLTQFRNNGLAIWFDAEPFAQSLSASTVIVTIEIPLPVSRRSDKTDAASYPAISVILDGVISVAGNKLRWLPDAEPLDDTLRRAIAQNVPISSLRLRVILKGHVIHSDQDVQLLHLDGQAFGRPKWPQSAAAAPTTTLDFPTGSGAPASDFESWFYLLDDSYGYGYGYGSSSIGGHLL